MNIYKKALEMKLRFNFKGRIGVEDLFNLTDEELNELYQTFPSKTGLIDVKNDGDELRKTIIKDIYEGRQQNKLQKKIENEIKENNQFIDELIKQKKLEGMKSLSIEQLEQMKK